MDNSSLVPVHKLALVVESSDSHTATQAAMGTCPSCVRSATALPVHHKQGTTVLQERDGGMPPSRWASCPLCASLPTAAEGAT